VRDRSGPHGPRSPLRSFGVFGLPPQIPAATRLGAPNMDTTARMAMSKMRVVEADKDPNDEAFRREVKTRQW